ncbi:MAG: recombination regulator RecX [Myxococcaceae bacterium]|nr:recombination regulator RecX [Myxococcaceae bacterium]
MAKTAFETAVKLLKGRAKSTDALRQALLAKDFSSDDVEAALTRCVELGYLNDGTLGRALAKKLLDDRRSLREVERKLTQAGVRDVREVLTWARAACDYDELAFARYWLAKRGLAGAKAARFLASRGFTEETLERLGFGPDGFA